MGLIKIPERWDITFKTIPSYFSLSDDSEFIPLICLVNNLAKTYSKGDNKTLTYGLPLNGVINSYSMPKIEAFCEYISLLSNPNVYISMSRSLLRHFGTINYFANYGTILYRDNELQENDIGQPLIPLMLLCVKRDYLFKIDKENPDDSHFCLVIDNSFHRNLPHSRLFRNVNRIYIASIAPSVDIFYTNNILEACFNQRSSALPKFDTIDKMREYLNGINQVLVRGITDELSVSVPVPTPDEPNRPIQELSLEGINLGIQDIIEDNGLTVQRLDDAIEQTLFQPNEEEEVLNTSYYDREADRRLREIAEIRASNSTATYIGGVDPYTEAWNLISPAVTDIRINTGQVGINGFSATTATSSGVDIYPEPRVRRRGRRQESNAQLIDDE